MLTIPDIDAAPTSILRSWWLDGLLRESEEVRERLAVRCEALGMVDVSGKLVDEAAAKR